MLLVTLVLPWCPSGPVLLSPCPAVGVDPLSTQGWVAALCSELLCPVCATCSATEMCSALLNLLYSLQNDTPASAVLSDNGAGL